MNTWTLLEFLVRIFGFAIALYFILDYIVACEVSTSIGTCIVVIVTVAVLVYFIKYGSTRSGLCRICKNGL